MRPYLFRARIGRRTVTIELESESPGDRGVYTLQARLAALELLTAEDMTGRPDERTREAVRRFQRFSGLRPTGDVHDARTRLLVRDAARRAFLAGAIPKVP